jgi:ribosomal-protein-serine acetyltransferase
MDWVTSHISSEICVDDLLIRQFVMEDAPQMVEAVTESLPELLQWMPWAKFEPQSVSQRKELILQWQIDWAEKRDMPMGVFRNGQMVGATGFHLRHGEGQMEIGYWVRTSCIGQGIATRTAHALTNVAFALDEVTEVLIAHDVANIRSRAVPERLGFTLVKEYEMTPNASAETGHMYLWSMKRGSWNAN